MRLNRWSAAQAALQILIYFGAASYLIYFHSLSASGLWSLTTGTLALARIADISGSSVLTRVLPRVKNKRLQIRLVDTTTSFGALVSLAILAVVVPILYGVTSGNAEGELQRNLWAILAITAVNFILVPASNSGLMALDGLHLQGRRLLVQSQSLIVFALITLALVPNFSVAGAALAQLGSTVVALISSRYYIRRVLPAAWTPSNFKWNIAKLVISFGFRLQMAAWPTIIHDSVMKILISKFIGLDAVAIFDLSNKVGTYCKFLLQSYFSPSIPKMATLVKTTQSASMLLAIGWSKTALLIGGGMFVAMAALTPLLSRFVLHEINFAFTRVSVSLFIGYYVSCIAQPFQILSQCRGKMLFNIVAQWLLPAFSISLMFAVQPDEVVAAGYIIGASLFLSSCLSLGLNYKFNQS
jgi:O-antigen/teichoic acid export membrane protein